MPDRGIELAGLVRIDTILRRSVSFRRRVGACDALPYIRRSRERRECNRFGRELRGGMRKFVIARSLAVWTRDTALGNPEICSGNTEFLGRRACQHVERGCRACTDWLGNVARRRRGAGSREPQCPHDRIYPPRKQTLYST